MCSGDDPGRLGIFLILNTKEDNWRGFYVTSLASAVRNQTRPEQIQAMLVKEENTEMIFTDKSEIRFWLSWIS